MDSNKKFPKPSDRSPSRTSTPERWGDGNANLTRKLAMGKGKSNTALPEGIERSLPPIHESETAGHASHGARVVQGRRKSTSDTNPKTSITGSRSRSLSMPDSWLHGIDESTEQEVKPNPLNHPSTDHPQGSRASSEQQRPIDTNPQDKVAKFYNLLREELTKQSSYLDNKEREHFQGTIKRLDKEKLLNQCKSIIASQKDITPKLLANGIIQRIYTLQEKRESGKDTRNSAT
jgi:hypothetical protein